MILKGGLSTNKLPSEKQSGGTDNSTFCTYIRTVIELLL